MGSITMVLAVAFCLVGAAATALQAWLWTFPMVPDPDEPDPNGKTSAPPQWRLVHRLLGYTFALLYIALLSMMVPRLRFLGEETITPPVVVHIFLGLVIAPLLVAKVLIIRRWQFWGRLLPTMGGLLLGMSILIVGIVFSPANRLARLPVVTAEDVAARQHLSTVCLSCHGASPIVASGSDESWSETLEEMREIAEKSGVVFLNSDSEVVLAAYLSRVLPREQVGRNESGLRGRREADVGHDED